MPHRNPLVPRSIATLLHGIRTSDDNGPCSVSIVALMKCISLFCSEEITSEDQLEEARKKGEDPKVNLSKCQNFMHFWDLLGGMSSSKVG